jgi:hypothetical protein
MLAAAIENEVAEYLGCHVQVRDSEGHRLVVRNGYLPPWKIQTGLGLVEVQQPRVNDRRVDEKGDRMRFSSQTLPPYLRRTKSLDELLPWLYLRGISSGDFTEALQALWRRASERGPGDAPKGGPPKPHTIASTVTLSTRSSGLARDGGPSGDAYAGLSLPFSRLDLSR